MPACFQDTLSPPARGREKDCSPLCDLHVHTHFSCDSEATIEAMCRQAITLGLRQVAFTEHVDFVPADAGYGFFRPAAYLAEVSRCRQLFGDQLAILAGVEIGEFHRFRSQANALLDAHRFDLVIGSLHWVKQGCVTAAPNPQPQPMDRAFRDYFDELQQMCSVGGFDIVGHLDVVKRNGFDTVGQYNVLDHERAIRSILDAIIRNGIALEINTSTLRRAANQTSPGQAVMTWYRQMGGRLLTIGSDAHTPAGLAAGWETAVEMARAAGFTHLTSFSNRTPCALSLDGKW